MTATAAAEGIERGDRPKRQASHRSRAGRSRTFRGFAVALGLAPVLGGTATAASAPHPSASLQARAATIAAEIGSANLQLHTLAERYLEADRRLATATTEERSTRQSIVTTRRRLASEKAALTAEAVETYVGAGATSVLGLYLEGTPDQVVTGQAYLGVAHGQLASTVTQLDGTTTRLNGALAEEASAAQEAEQALNAANVSRSQVLQTVSRENSILTSVKGQLAAAVAAAEQAREQAAAAAAAAEAARQAAAAAAAAATSTTLVKRPAAPSAVIIANAGPPSAAGIVAVATSTIPAGTLAADFAGIRRCESGDNYSLNTGNGYYGAYQFGLGTWQSLGQTGLPSAAPPPTQDSAALALYKRSGSFNVWPECAAILGLS